MASYGTVKYGARGDSVSELQRLLNQNGFALSVDGIFGDKTLQAVRDYQTRTGLAVDGIVGTNTWGALSGSGGSTGGAAAGSGSVYSPTGSAGYLTYADQYAGARPSYAPSQAYQDAADRLAQLEGARPGPYQSGYQEQIDALLQKIQNRDPFEYDFNADPLYQQYKGNYMQMGQQAMQDTMGNAAALTGGYGNSYAATAGNQAYQQYLQGLNNVIPALRDAAYGMYRDQGTDMYNEMGLLQGMENTAYGKYRDTVGDWQTDRGYYYGQQNDLYNRDYGQYMDSLGQWNADRSFGYQGAYDAQQQANWEREYELAAQKARSGGSGGGSKSADKITTVGNLSTSELDAVARNIYKNTGMQDPIKRVQGTSYTQAQKEYLMYRIELLMKGAGG